MHPANNVESLFPRDLDPAELDRVISLPEAVEAPITAGDKLGTMELRDGDTVYASVDLLASSDVTADKFMVFRHNVTLFFKKPAVKTVAIVLAGTAGAAGDLPADRSQPPTPLRPQCPQLQQRLPGPQTPLIKFLSISKKNTEAFLKASVFS